MVAVSTKDDLFAATALVRALQGRLWHFAPDGVEATPAGCRPLRWSPVSAAADWDTAVTTAEVMIATTDRTLGTHARTEGGFWFIQAGSILAPLLHAAALAGRDMRTVLSWAASAQLAPRRRAPGRRPTWWPALIAPPRLSCPVIGAQRMQR